MIFACIRVNVCAITGSSDRLKSKPGNVGTKQLVGGGTDQRGQHVQTCIDPVCLAWFDTIGLRWAYSRTLIDTTISDQMWGAFVPRWSRIACYWSPIYVFKSIIYKMLRFSLIFRLLLLNKSLLLLVHISISSTRVLEYSSTIGTLLQYT